MGIFLRRGYAPHRTRFADLAVERTIKLNLAGTPWAWLVVQQGLPSDIYDASCDGTWLLLRDIYENRQWNNTTSNVLETSTVHSYLNGDFINLFDDNIKDNIKQVKIPYRRNGGSGGTNQSGANGLSCKVFLLGGYEVGFTASDIGAAPVDSAKLDYFESGTETTADNRRIAYLNGSTAYWWLRSPSTSGTGNARIVTSSGDTAGKITSKSYGIRPAIILPSDMLVTDDILPPNMKTVSIMGRYFGGGYVMIGDTKYTKATLLTADTGTTIVAHVGASDSTGVAGCKIYFNGDLVKTGTSSYSFTLEGDITITFVRPDGSTSAIECYIVMQ